MRLALNLLPEEIILQYNLQDIAEDGYVYLEMCKKMYGLLQADMLPNNHITKHLATYGYIPTDHTTGLWRQKMRPIHFTLVVEKFEFKYVDQHNSDHLLSVWDIDPLAIEKYQVS